MGSKVCLSRDKYNTMCCLESEHIKRRLTTDWTAGRVHVLPMMQLNVRVGQRTGKAVRLFLWTASLSGNDPLRRSCRSTWGGSPASTIVWWPSSPPAGPSASRWRRWKTFNPSSVATSQSMVCSRSGLDSGAFSLSLQIFSFLAPPRLVLSAWFLLISRDCHSFLFHLQGFRTASTAALRS